MMARSELHRVLAFFGSDLAFRNSYRFLRRASERGYTLLALDSAAMALATRSDVPYVLVDEVLDAEAIASALKKGDECARNWFQDAREEFTVDGVCWPDIDHIAMRWFWPNVMIALELATALKIKDCREFSFFGNLLRRPSVLFLRSDACNTLWAAEFQRKATSRRIIVPPIHRFFGPGIRKLLARMGRTANAPVERGADSSSLLPQGGVIVVMGPGEEYRFTHVLSQLKGCFPDQVGVVIASPYSELSAEIASTWGIPVMFGPAWPMASWFASLPVQLLPTPDRSLQQRFLGAYRKVVKASAGQPWHKPVKQLEYHFRHYCCYRWPFLHRVNFEFWVRTWERFRPRALLVTTRPEAVFRAVVEAGNQVGITSFAIPHGGVSGTDQPETAVGSDFILCNSVLLKRVLQQAGVKESRLLCCSGLLARNEYIVQPRKIFSSGERLRLLALTEPTDEGPNLIKTTTLLAQLTALRALVTPPADLADKVEVAIKVHPFISDLEMLEAAGEEVRNKMAPRDSDLHSVLLETDLVVGINYRGTALMHAMLSGKPVVSLLTEKDPLLNRTDYRYDTFEEGTVVARTPEDLWNIVRSCLHDARFAENLRLKAERFANEMLDDTASPSLCATLESLLAARGDRFHPRKRVSQ
jgi:hypothetical protein